MYLPNYKDGSIVNLMSSIKKSFGGKSLYQPLNNFDDSSISNKNVVLLVIDGLGYEYLEKYGKESFLYKNLKGKMTSVFPATTASAMTSFATGVAPQQHALTGWFMYLKEMGMTSIILPFTSRAGEFKFWEKNINYEDIYEQKSFFEDLKANSFSIKHKSYSESKYSLLTSKGAKTLGHSNLNGFFRQINKALNNNGRKFILAYWAKFDSICHREGTDSKKALEHFKELDKKISTLAKSLKDKNTTVIVTADHGLINTEEKERVLKLENYPKLADTLSMPLSGEPRVVYCYVQPSKVKEFESYIKTNFKNYCVMYKSEELIKKGFFGLFEPHRKLKNRIGDHTLIMKENYIIKDLLLGENQNIFIGNHGGVSKEEMFVPLIIIG